MGQKTNNRNQGKDHLLATILIPPNLVWVYFIRGFFKIYFACLHNTYYILCFEKE